MEKKVWLFYFLNDYSGSPLVLKNTVLALKSNHKITVCTSSTEGFLSNLDGVAYKFIKYEWSPIKLLTLFRFIKVQFILFLLVVNNASKIDIIYVNTLLPFGAAIAAKLIRKKVIYHLHEPQVGSMALFRFLAWVACWSSNRVIFVSEFLSTCFPVLKQRGVVVYNVLNEAFTNQIKAKYQKSQESGTVLMLCSFKAYKGVYDFVDLAKSLPLIRFELVLNAKHEIISSFVESLSEVDNLTIFSSARDVHVHYQRANVVLNLSHPKEWTESFGMTVLEGLAYGKPCIVPLIGGAVEVIDSSCGYSLSHENKKGLNRTIQELYSNAELYSLVSKNAVERSSFFSFKNYSSSLNTIIS